MTTRLGGDGGSGLGGVNGGVGGKGLSSSNSNGSGLSNSNAIAQSAVEHTRYVYDENGNIREIRDGYNQLQSSYKYDALNRLTSEIGEQGETSEYGYDNNGNLLYKKLLNSANIATLANPKTKLIPYEYDGDRLLSYNGEKCTYDSLGNPTTYRGNKATWSHLRNLRSYKGVDYSYNASGLRLGKKHGSRESKYYWSNGNLLRETTAINTNSITTNNSTTIDYIYGVDGIVGLILKQTSPQMSTQANEKTYYYLKNLQGDVTHIVDDSGNIQASYKYDAWGNHKVYDASGNEIANSQTFTIPGLDSHIGIINPIRYRGYYFDTETGLYYLKSRYYDPQVGRFINADTIEEAYASKDIVNGLNLYSYCNNNPIMHTDDNGSSWWKWVLFGIGAALVVAAAVVLTVATFGAGAVFASMGGAILIGAAKGTLIGAAIGATVGVAGGAIYAGVTGADMGDSILQGFLMGFGGGAIIGAAIGGAVGGMAFSKAASAWHGGTKAMTSHFLEKGVAMGFKNPVAYTKAAQGVIQNGMYLASKNAYATMITTLKYNYVGVAQGGIKITTFFAKTFTKTAAKILGLIL